MGTDSDNPKKAIWPRCLLNSFLAWLLGFIIYMVPSLVVAFRMGFELGPKSNDSAAVSRQISATISGMYRDNLWLSVGYVLVMAVLIYLRSHVISRKEPRAVLLHGILVGSIPAVISVAQLLFSSAGLTELAVIIVFLASGAAGSYRKAVPASAA